MKKAKFALRRRIGTTIVFISVLLLVILGGAPRARAQNECKVVFDADDKLLATDHHSYQTSTPGAPGSAPRTSEGIMVGGVSYIQVNGAWRKSSMTVAQIRDQKAENRKNAKNISCHHVRDESVGGEAARVFSAHSETEDDKSDATVWISKSRGVPLRQDQETDVGGGAAGKVRYSVRYEYANVSAPPVK